MTGTKTQVTQVEGLDGSERREIDFIGIAIV